MTSRRSTTAKGVPPRKDTPHPSPRNQTPLKRAGGWRDLDQDSAWEIYEEKLVQDECTPSDESIDLDYPEEESEEEDDDDFKEEANLFVQEIWPVIQSLIIIEVNKLVNQIVRSGLLKEGEEVKQELGRNIVDTAVEKAKAKEEEEESDCDCKDFEMCSKCEG